MDRRPLLVALTLALPLAGCGSGSGSSPTPVVTPSALPTPPAPTLVLSDTFDRPELGDQWRAGGTCDPGSGGPPGPAGAAEETTIVLTGGRVRATANCNYIETRASFGGDVRVVFDVEKVRAGLYPCWDYFVELRGFPAAAGSILFDFGGRDAVRLGPGCADGAGVEGESPDSGTAALVLSAGTIGFTFTNSAGATLDAGTANVGSVESARVRIWLAGLPESPRYLDNVRIFASTMTAAGAAARP
jgi:hypothetical protein